MKKSVLILCAVIAVASATSVPVDLPEKVVEQLFKFFQGHEVAVEPQEDPAQLGWILNHEAKKKVRAIVDTMPCGWPEYGIPPLAPYRREEMLIEIKKSVLETITELIRFRIDGLDDMIIQKLKVSYTFSKKVKFTFNFPKIRISGKYVTDTLLDFMAQYGVSIRYEGDGDFVIDLDNLVIDGSFKYKMPFIFGSIKIYKFNAVVTLGGSAVHLNNLLGNGRMNNMINEQVEDTIMWAVNGNQETISQKIEETLVPTVNAKLKGHKIWSLLGGSSTSTCVAPPDPWA